MILRYELKTSKGETQSVTALMLYMRVMREKDMNYKWTFPINEIIKVLQDTSFPDKYGIAIRIAILNVYMRRLNLANCRALHYSWSVEEEAAACHCFNSLYSVATEDAVAARTRFLKELLANATQLGYLNPHYHPGITFLRLRRRIIEKKFDEYIVDKNADLGKISKAVHTIFIENVKIAEQSHSFEKDAIMDERLWKKYLA